MVHMWEISTRMYSPGIFKFNVDGVYLEIDLRHIENYNEEKQAITYTINKRIREGTDASLIRNEMELGGKKFVSYRPADNYYGMVHINPDTKRPTFTLWVDKGTGDIVDLNDKFVALLSRFNLVT